MGDINISGAFRVNGTALANSWVAGTPSTNIYYTAGKVGIGTSTTPICLLELKQSIYTTPLLAIDAGGLNDSTNALPRGIGKPLLRLGGTSYSSTSGDYYGIGLGYAPLASSFACCEIGCLATGVTGNGIGDLVFSTRPNNTNVVATERM